MRRHTPRPTRTDTLFPYTTLFRSVLASGDMRTNLDLSGLWHYSIDPYRDGMAGFHGGDPGLGHRRYDTTDVAAAMRDDPAALYEYDMTRSPKIGRAHVLNSSH